MVGRTVRFFRRPSSLVLAGALLAAAFSTSWLFAGPGRDALAQVLGDEPLPPADNRPSAIEVLMLRSALDACMTSPGSPPSLPESATGMLTLYPADTAGRYVIAEGEELRYIACAVEVERTTGFRAPPFDDAHTYIISGDTLELAQ